MRLTVARVGRAHGLKGEVTIETRTDAPERRFVPGAVLHVVPARRDPQPVPATVVVSSVRDHNGVLLIGFDDVPDRSAAEVLRGTLLEADIPDDEQEPDAWYDHQLVGLAVVDPAGRPLGEVAAVEHPGAQDLLVVRRPDGVERLVPFVTAIVPTVDVAGGRVVVDAPGGLIEDLPDGGPEG
jgi:16S rRNA processing protein RimM